MYHYEDLEAAEFENLVIAICKEILGEATQGFTRGKDGGRDAVFQGCANVYPSRSLPWTGCTVIQAKHTHGINKNFLESDFFGAKNSILNKEIPKCIYCHFAFFFGD